MKRFLLISKRLNTISSAPKCNYNLAVALRRLKYEVHVLTSYINQSIHSKFDKLDIIIHKVNKLYARRELSPIFYTLIAKWLRYEYDIDIVIGNGYTFNDNITWVHFLRRQFLGNLKEIRQPLPVQPKYSNFELYIEIKMLKSAKLLWALSNMCVKGLIELYSIPSERIFLLPNGVDVEFYRPLSDDLREEIRQKYELVDKKMILFVGEPIRKGLMYLINGLRKSRIRHKVTIFAVGFNPNYYKDVFTKMLNNDLKVKLLGKVSTDELKTLYQITDIVVLPSIYDPFSLVILEAMACGAIPIVSYYVGASDILLKHDVGKVIEFSEKAIISAIEGFVDNDELLAKQRMKARKVAEQYSWANVAKELLLIVNSKLFNNL